MDLIDTLFGPIIFIIIILFSAWKARQEEKANKAQMQNQQEQPFQMQMEMDLFRQLQEGDGASFVMPANNLPFSVSNTIPVYPAIHPEQSAEIEQNISMISDEFGSPQSQSAPSMNYAESLMTPDGIRNAIVLSEILRRPEERWEMSRN